MSKIEKMIERLKTVPADFTYKEMVSLLEALGFRMDNKGRSSGSRVKFVRGNVELLLHRPHPRKEIKPYQIRQVLDILREEELI